jgi:hypothetical protein
MKADAFNAQAPASLFKVRGTVSNTHFSKIREEWPHI